MFFRKKPSESAAPVTQMASLGGENPELKKLLVSQTYETPPELDTRTRVALFTGSETISFETLVVMEDHEITVALMLSNGVNGTNVRLAGIDGHTLRRLGVRDAQQLRVLNLSAEDFALDPNLAQTCCDAFGIDDVRVAFLATPKDAVLIASEPCQTFMQASTGQLLLACEGSPVEAGAVLTQLGPHCIDGTPIDFLVKTGIHAEDLKRAGVTLNDILYQSPTSAQLLLLGYRL